MAYLLNRVAAGRIECLHALMTFIVEDIGTYKSFNLSTVKYKKEGPNIHKYCSVLKTHPTGFKYCPFKDNPLDEAGCGLTNGYKPEYDSTKSKEVSNTINALHALGFVHRTGRDIKVLPEGIKFARCAYGSSEMQECIVRAVLHYGPVVGVVKQLITDYKIGDSFNSSSIFVGYPNTLERVNTTDKNVVISVGSKKDSITRTKSCVLAWLTAAGIIRPKECRKLGSGELAHMAYRDYLMSENRNQRIFVLVKNPYEDLNNMLCTQQPLNYDNLTKNTGSLRENNQAVVRDVTLAYEKQVKNRRFAICYILDKGYRESKPVPLNIFKKIFLQHPNQFIISQDNIEKIIEAELPIANSCGIPFDKIDIDGAIYLKPFCCLDKQEFSINAPKELTDILSKIDF